MVLAGRAGLAIKGDTTELVLGPGDAVYLKAGCRHRVSWTVSGTPTVWLALFLDPTLAPKTVMRE